MQLLIRGVKGGVNAFLSGVNSVSYGLKSCIFVEVDDLRISGRYALSETACQAMFDSGYVKIRLEAFPDMQLIKLMSSG